MNRFSKFALVIAAMIPAVAAAEMPLPQGKPVVDASNIIPDDQEAAMVNQILAYEKQTGHQLVVATVPTLDGDSVEDYAQAYFRAVKIGGADRDDGTLFLISQNPRKMRIHTGYGMRSMITDADASVILRDDVVPLAKAGDIPGGIQAGVNTIIEKTTSLSPQAQALLQREKEARAQRSAAGWAKFWDFMLAVGMFIGGMLGLLGLGKLVTLPARRRKARELEEARKADLKRREDEQAARAARDAADIQRFEKERREEEAEEQRQAALAERRERDRVKRAKEAREKMLNAMTPADRKAFLDKEEFDRKEAIRISREKEQARLEAARLAELERQRQWEAGRPQREAAERARLAQERRDADERKRQDEEDAADQRRRDSYTSSSFSSDSSSSDSSSSDSSSWSGGGGDSGGGGSSSDY